jgi:putative chitinase
LGEAKADLSLQETLKKLAPRTPAPKRDRFLPFLEEAMPRYGINTELRLAAFLATICFESDYFKATSEYASGMAYDITVNPKKARALGNTMKGDGPLFKGRGLIQLTGRYNYALFDEYVDSLILAGNTPLDGCEFILDNPASVATPLLAVESACWFWQTSNLNKYADKGNFFATQGLVNRGSATKKALDYEARLKLYDIALRAIDISPADTVRPSDANPLVKPSDATTHDTDPPNGTESAKEAGETFFNKATTWISEKRSKLSQIGIEPDISGTSKAVIGSVKGTGWSSLLYGFFAGNWFYILIGVAMVALGVWYLSRSKDRKDARSSTTPQNQQTNVIVK